MILGVSCALSEEEVHWRGFLIGLKKRGIGIPNLITSDAHSGLKAALKASFNADDRAHAEERLKDFVKTYRESQPKHAAWAEDNLPEGFNVFAFPEAQRKEAATIFNTAGK